MKYWLGVFKNGEHTGEYVVRASYKTAMNWALRQFAKDETICIELRNLETGELIKVWG